MTLFKKTNIFILSLLVGITTFAEIQPSKEQVIIGSMKGDLTIENHSVSFTLVNGKESTKVIFKGQLPAKLQVCKDNITLTGTYKSEVFEAKSIATTCFELPDMADDYRANGKIYVVVAVVVVVLLGVIAYLFSINKRIDQLNEEN